MGYSSLQQHSKNHEEYTDLIKLFKQRYLEERAERFSKLTIHGVSFPEELIIEILSWLPVKTLLQFKTVSKSWYTIIVSCGFISKHLTNYYNNNHDMNCLLTLQQFCVRNDSLNLSVRLIDESLGVYARLQLKAPLLDFEISQVFYGTYCLSGPCNGIYHLSGPRGNRLWNPTINDLKVLPPLVMKPSLPIFLQYKSFDAHGFGYDPLSQDYKVVVIKGYAWKYNFLCLDESQIYQYPPSVLVYSLKNDSWKYWGDLPQFYDNLNNNNTHIFVNGCLYWVAERQRNFEAIISFNICTNVLEEIQIPNYEKNCQISLGVYKGSVSFYTINNSFFCGGKRCFEMWTFNEGWWTKKVSIGHMGEPYG